MSVRVKTISREEFRRDPAAAMREARDGQRVVVLDSEGKPALTISSQGELPEDAELRRLRERVAELEDHIRRERASDWMHSSYGRDEMANRMLAGVAARRGEDWTGAEVSNEPATQPAATDTAGGSDGEQGVGRCSCPQEIGDVP